MHDTEREQQLKELQRDLADIARRAAAIDAEMLTYLIEMSMAQVAEDLAAERGDAPKLRVIDNPR